MMDHAHELLARRWPRLAAVTPRLEPAPGGRLVWGGVSMVSPLAPEKEARRLVEQAFPRGVPERVLLMGHGNGALEHELLAAGAGRLRIQVADTDYLGRALACWIHPSLFNDPRVELLAPGQDVILEPGEQLLEPPAILRAFPEACARLRVQLGRLRSAERRLRILVVEPVAGGSLPIARHAARAFSALGHTVQSVSFEGMAQAHRSLLDTVNRHRQGRTLISGFEELLGRMVLLEAARFRPDFVFALAQSPVSAPVSEQLRAQGARTAFWFVEDFETMPYWKALHGHFDLFLTIQRGRFHKALAEQSSAPVRYLPVCSEPSVYFPEPFPDGQRPGLGFVGAGYHNRETAFLELRDLGLRIWGSDWNPAHPCFDLVQDEGRRTDEQTNRRVFSSSRINLNLHSSTYHAGVDPDGDFVNPRVFDILACGGFQLCDHRSLLPELLTPGEHLVCYNSIPELREAVPAWLARPEQARAIAEAGRREVLARHTYTIRMAECLELAFQLGEDGFPAAAPRRAPVLDSAQDPELAAWLAALPADVEHTVDGISAWVRNREGELDETARLFLYMARIQEWARSKGIDQMLEGAPRG
jgi:spore maturation protein CgeB